MAAALGETVLYSEPTVDGGYIPAVVHVTRDSWNPEFNDNGYFVPQPNVDRVHLMVVDPNMSTSYRYHVAEGVTTGTYMVLP